MPLSPYCPDGESVVESDDELVLEDASLPDVVATLSDSGTDAGPVGTISSTSDGSDADDSLLESDCDALDDAFSGGVTSSFTSMSDELEGEPGVAGS